MSKKSCDFASAWSRKVKNGQDFASAGDQHIKTLNQGIIFHWFLYERIMKPFFFKFQFMICF